MLKQVLLNTGYFVDNSYLDEYLLRRARMNNKEELIAVAHTVQELINILKDKVPADADVDVGNMSTTEVWYDESLNNVIFR